MAHKNSPAVNWKRQMLFNDMGGDMEGLQQRGENERERKRG
jgi:hypothetical protein